MLTDPSGSPVWTSPVEPRSTHDIFCAREHAVQALYPAAATGLPTLTDKGYTGAGIGTKVRTKGARRRDVRERQLVERPDESGEQIGGDQQVSIIGLVGAVLAEQQDEWTEGRRYLGLDVLTRARAVDRAIIEEVTEPELQALAP